MRVHIDRLRVTDSTIVIAIPAVLLAKALLRNCSFFFLFIFMHKWISLIDLMPERIRRWLCDSTFYLLRCYYYLWPRKSNYSNNYYRHFSFTIPLLAMLIQLWISVLRMILLAMHIYRVTDPLEAYLTLFLLMLSAAIY